MTVHPHARGERVGLIVADDRLVRFIPTPVGNASTKRLASATTTVHPHARGERPSIIGMIYRGCGSSPRPWGTPMASNGGLRWRLVHPHARGERELPPSDRLHRHLVHPHARGERAICAPSEYATPGSSPRPWGTLIQLDDLAQDGRFIPTPVGNACGCERSGREQHGSSPRPWGTLPEPGDDVGHGRFIPTPVGNAIIQAPTSRSVAVHPHARGERGAGQAGVSRRDGSSPRPWGTPGHDSHAGGCRRFIPTPVGNAHRGCSPPPACPVHPHARGERVGIQ